MSLFGSLLRDFDEDPFGFHREQFRRLERMMDSFNMSPFENMFSPFGFPPMLAPSAFNQRHQAHANHNRSMMPYGYGREIMFPSMSSVYSDLERMSNDPQCHMFSSSSVMTYTTGQDGRPQLYQATSSMRTAPGGVKETRRSMSDTASGMQSLAIGHHLGERAHILERTQNRLTGERDESQEFINLEEDDAEAFGEEWKRKTNQPIRASIAAPPQERTYYEQEQPAPLAITAGPSSRERHSRKRENRSEDEEGGRSEKSRKSHKHKHSSKPKHETSI